MMVEGAQQISVVWDLLVATRIANVTRGFCCLNVVVIARTWSLSCANNIKVAGVFYTKLHSEKSVFLANIKIFISMRVFTQQLSQHLFDLSETLSYGESIAPDNKMCLVLHTQIYEFYKAILSQVGK